MSDLSFHEFDSPFTNPNTDQRPVSSVGYDTANLVTGNIDSSSNADAKTQDGGAGFPAGPNVFSFKYYQQFFDVDQEQVQNRLLRSVIPSPASNFIMDHIQPLPDLYGPLWISVTLIFSTAICGNLAHYIESKGVARETDFGLVTGASSLILSYVLIIPFAIYWALWYRKAAIQYSYLELLCAYGYSLTVFIPVSILYVIHLEALRWLLILGGLGVSGLLLFNVVWPAVKSDPNRAAAFAIIGGVLLLHTGLAFTFKTYYFDSSIPSAHGLQEVPAIPQAPDGPSPAVAAPAESGPKAEAQVKITERAVPEAAVIGKGPLTAPEGQKAEESLTPSAAVVAPKSNEDSKEKNR